MADDFTAVFAGPVDQAPDLDELVRATMHWHFSSATGSPYWTGRRSELSFDPLVDVRTFADLRLFDDVSVEWSRIPADQLIPVGGRTGQERFSVYESGGATGPPKRVVDASSRGRNAEFLSLMLDQAGFPRGEGGWLHVGPTGPHVMAKNNTNLAWMRGFLCYYIDLDPRWARRCMAQRRQDVFRLYLDHIADQVMDIMSTQDISVMSCTPPLLEHLVSRPDLYVHLKAKIRGILWGGTTISPETLRLLETEIFPEAVISGAYGNTMMGIAPQRPRREGDLSACVFRPFYPYSVVEVVDPSEPTKPVAEDAAGRVKITTLTRDLFVPPTLERDNATRRRPADGYLGIELSDIKPRDTGTDAVVEGVY